MIRPQLCELIVELRCFSFFLGCLELYQMHVVHPHFMHHSEKLTEEFAAIDQELVFLK